MYSFKAGYQGHDSMREKAEKAFRDEMHGADSHKHYKRGGHTKHHSLSREQSDLHIPRKFEVREHKRNGKKRHEAIPHYSLGGLLGKVGGFLGGLFGDKGREIGSEIGSTLGGFNDEMGDTAKHLLPFLRKGGSLPRNKRHHEEHEHRRHEHEEEYERGHHMKRGKKHNSHHYAHGGNVYEKEMVGEHPSHKAHHYDYESQMRGMHPISRAGHSSHHESGHHTKKMAAGGVGKIRHKEATRAGKPINHRHKRYAEGGEAVSTSTPLRIEQSPMATPPKEKMMMADRDRDMDRKPFRRGRGMEMGRPFGRGRGFGGGRGFGRGRGFEASRYKESSPRPMSLRSPEEMDKFI